MNRFGKYKDLLIPLIIIFLIIHFPLTGKDLFWSNYTIKSLQDFLNIANGNILSSSFAYVLTKYKLLKILTMTVSSYILFLLIKNIINKKNTSLVFMSIFLFFLTDKVLIASSFIQASGFTEHFIGTIFILLYLNLLSKNYLTKLNIPLLFILGLSSTLISKPVSFTIFVITIIHFTFKDNHEKNYKELSLFTGELLGLILITLTSTISYNDISNTLFNTFIPNIKSSNFIITIILSCLLLLETFKKMNKDNNVEYSLAIASILVFLATSLIEVFNITYYLTLLFYIGASYYILKNTSKNVLFKRVVDYYMLIKIFYTCFIILTNSVSIGSTFLLTILDIIIILELYNYLLPPNFMQNTWIAIGIVMILTNIYIYSDVSKRNQEMNQYIKNKLESTEESFEVPNKYNTDYLVNVLPTNQEELKWYLDYHNIKPLKDIKDIDLHYTK